MIATWWIISSSSKLKQSSQSHTVCQLLEKDQTRPEILQQLQIKLCLMLDLPLCVNNLSETGNLGMGSNSVVVCLMNMLNVLE